MLAAKKRAILYSRLNMADAVDRGKGAGKTCRVDPALLRASLRQATHETQDI
jgi:hypothetical protein